MAAIAAQSHHSARFTQWSSAHGSRGLFGPAPASIFRPSSGEQDEHSCTQMMLRR